MSEARAREIATALAAHASERFSTEVSIVGEPTTAGEGMDNEIVFATLRGPGLPDDWAGDLVIRVQPDADRFDIARDEAAVQEWCQEVGYPAPRVLALFAPGELAGPSAQVMERAPGVPMLQALVPTLWRAPGLVGLLAELHVRLHRASVEEFPLIARSLARRRLQPVVRWVDELDDPLLRTALERVEQLLPYLEDHPGAACHGDFHPLNILVTVSGPRSSTGPTQASAIATATSPAPSCCSASPRSRQRPRWSGRSSRPPGRRSRRATCAPTTPAYRSIATAWRPGRSSTCSTGGARCAPCMPGSSAATASANGCRRPSLPGCSSGSSVAWMPRRTSRRRDGVTSDVVL